MAPNSSDSPTPASLPKKDSSYIFSSVNKIIHYLQSFIIFTIQRNQNAITSPHLIIPFAALYITKEESMNNRSEILTQRVWVSRKGGGLKPRRFSVKSVSPDTSTLNPHINPFLNPLADKLNNCNCTYTMICR
jgi:hypothetical protein